MKEVTIEIGEKDIEDLKTIFENESSFEPQVHQDRLIISILREVLDIHRFYGRLYYDAMKMACGAIGKICSEIITKVGAQTIKDMGKVMGELKKNYSDSIDFSKAGSILKELLNKQ